MNKAALRPLHHPKSSLNLDIPFPQCLWCHPQDTFIQGVNTLLVLTILLQHLPHTHQLSSHFLQLLVLVPVCQAGGA